MVESPLPPWLARPDIPRGSIGWRMGDGEAAYDFFYRWFGNLTDEQAAQFVERNPEPEEWHGQYAMIREHPWK